MSNTQTRWFCENCEREWVYAHGWAPEHGCPACHATGIRKESYQPQFPGADLPRKGPITPELAAAGFAYHVADVAERVADREEKNRTLALSSPEFG